MQQDELTALKQLDHIEHGQERGIDEGNCPLIFDREWMLAREDLCHIIELIIII